MNQRNYSVSAEEKQELIKISREVRKEIINAMRKAEIFQRKRKLTRYTILFEALYKYLADGLSFYRLASYMDCRYNVKLSVTAWKKQLYRAIPILRRIVKEYMAKHVMSACQAQGQRKAYALDATAFSSEGHSGTSTRVHSQVALMDGLCRYDKITDEHGAESVKNFPIEAGALYLADRAYAKAQQIAWMIDHQADLLFRFSPKHVALYRDPACTRRLDVDPLLDCGMFSRICYIQYQKKVYQVRLMGKQLPEEARAAAEKKYVRKRVRIRRGYRNERCFMRTGCFC